MRLPQPWPATTLQLAWADGEGFSVEETGERDDNTIADELLATVMANGGASWNAVEELTTCARPSPQTRSRPGSPSSSWRS